MIVPRPLIYAVSTLTLTAAFATAALAQGAAGQTDEGARQEVLDSQSGIRTDSAQVPARDGHAVATNCADLLAEENRTASNSERTEINRQSAGNGQVNQGSSTSPNGGAGGTATNNGVAANTEGSSGQLNEDHAALTLEECRNQQNAIPNGEPNGSGQGANQAAPGTSNQGPATSR